MEHYVEILIRGDVPHGNKNAGHKAIVMSETLTHEIVKLCEQEGLLNVVHSRDMKRGGKQSAA